MSKVLALEKAIASGVRPYANMSIDELFDELVDNAELAEKLLDFARGIYAETNKGTVDVSAVMAFVEAVSMPMHNVMDGLRPIIHELKQREAVLTHAAAHGGYCVPLL